MQNRVNIAKDMLIALEELSTRELEAIGVQSCFTQMRSAHRILRKAALVEETRAFTKEVGVQCHDYRTRFDKCFALGLPGLFSSSGDIYDEDVYLQRLHIIMRDDSTMKSIKRQVEARDINKILKNCYDILSGLKEAFKSKNQPEYKKGAELCLAVDIAEEFRYPLGK